MKICGREFLCDEWNWNNKSTTSLADPRRAGASPTHAIPEGREAVQLDAPGLARQINHGPFRRLPLERAKTGQCTEGEHWRVSMDGMDRLARARPPRRSRHGRECSDGSSTSMKCPVRRINNIWA